MLRARSSASTPRKRAWAGISGHGVSTRAFNHPYDGQPGIPILNAAEKSTSGLYVARLTYRTAPPPLWSFA